MGYLLLEALLCSLSSTAKVLLHLRMVLSRIFQTLVFEPRNFLSIFVMFIKIKETARNVELDDTCTGSFTTAYVSPNIIIQISHICISTFSQFYI